VPDLVRFCAMHELKMISVADFAGADPMDPNKPKQKERKNRLSKDLSWTPNLFGSCRAGRSGYRQPDDFSRPRG
jgi:hypothetical protein